MDFSIFIVNFVKKDIMEKIYQPFIITKADEIINFMKTGFDVFEDIGVKSTEYTKERLCDILTERFIKGEYNENDEILDIFSNDDILTSFLSEISIQSDLKSLIDKGLIGLLDDDNGRDFYFVTKKGKECVKQMNNKK